MMPGKDSSNVNNPTEGTSSAANTYTDTVNPEKTLEELRTEQETLEGQINADTPRKHSCGIKIYAMVKNKY